MIDNITCDTPISNILDVSSIEDKLDEMKTVISTYTESIEGTLSKERISGGLSTSAFYINKEPLLYLESIKDSEHISLLQENYNAYCTNVIFLANEQRKKEIEMLKKKVLEKIESLTDAITSKDTFLHNLKQMVNPSSVQETEDEINKLKAVREKYRKKYNILCNLK